MNKRWLYVISFWGVFSCAEVGSKKTAQTQTDVRNKLGSKTIEFEAGAKVQLENDQTGEARLKLTEPDLSQIESWSAPQVSLQLIPSAEANRSYLGVSWTVPDTIKIFAEVSLCQDKKCIKQLTLDKFISFPGYPEEWTGSKGIVHVRLCADGEEAQIRCTPSGQSEKELKGLKSLAADDAGLQTLATRQRAIGYSRKFYDILAEYKKLSLSIPDTVLTFKKQAIDNALVAGRMNLAISVAQYRSTLANDLRFSFPTGEDSLQLAAQDAGKNASWLYYSDYELFSETRKKNFELALNNPKFCGQLRFADKTGPLVDDYNKQWNKTKVLACIDKIANEVTEEKFVGEVAGKPDPKKTTTYRTGTFLLGAGILTGFVTLMAWSPTFSLFVFLGSASDNIDSGRYLRAGLDVAAASTVRDSDAISGKSALIGGGIAIGLIAAGAALMAQAESSMKLAQVSDNPASAYLEREMQQFFKGLAEILQNDSW